MSTDRIFRIAAAAVCAAVTAGAAQAYDAKQHEVSIAVADPYPVNVILCLAGCSKRPPVSIYTAQNVPASPDPELGASAKGAVIGDVWCGARGGCVASNLAHRPLRNDGDTSISVFHYSRR